MLIGPRESSQKMLLSCRRLASYYRKPNSSYRQRQGRCLLLIYSTNTILIPDVRLSRWPRKSRIIGMHSWIKHSEKNQKCAISPSSSHCSVWSAGGLLGIRRQTVFLSPFTSHSLYRRNRFRSGFCVVRKSEKVKPLIRCLASQTALNDRYFHPYLFALAPHSPPALPHNPVLVDKHVDSN